MPPYAGGGGRGRTAARVLAAVASCLAVCAALLGGRGAGAEATLSAYYPSDTAVAADVQLVSREAANLRETIAAAEGSPAAVASLFGSAAGPLTGPQPDVDNVPLADDVDSASAARGPEDPGQVAMAQAQTELRAAQRRAAREAMLHAAEVEKAGLEKKVRRERAEYLRVALKERAAEGEAAAKQLRKQMLRRQAHLEHVERERRRQREAQAEVRKARRWVKHQQQVRERVEGKLGMREVDHPSLLSPLSGGDEAVKTARPLVLGHTSFQSAENMGTLWGRKHIAGKIQPEQRQHRASVMSIWKTLTGS